VVNLKRKTRPGFKRRCLDMKILVMFLAIIILACVTSASGNIPAKESGNQPRDCEKRFSELDATHKGYLDPENFRRELEGTSGQGKMPSYGKVISEFAAADKNGDGKVTKEEFCNWESHRK
jgi:Ca2+-binding EF-hand superfamily protein